jgi:hypothetical protein
MSWTAPSAIALAKRESDEARARVASTLGELQQRLKPKALANQAWSGVREKSGEIADDAVQAVKDRPVAASGLAVAFMLFLAREPILSAASKWLGGSKAGAKKPRGTNRRRKGSKNNGSDEGVSDADDRT